MVTEILPILTVLRLILFSPFTGAYPARRFSVSVFRVYGSVALLALVLSGSALADHPSLYFTSSTLNEAKARLISDERLQAGWSNCLKQALRDQERREWDGGACERLAFAYALVGHEGLGRAAVDMLLRAARMPSWHDGHRADRRFPWHSGLRTSALCISVGTAYDWAYRAMTPEERKIIRSALIEKGIIPILSDWSLPGTRIHCLDSMGHNWWAVCLSGAGVGALAVLQEEPRAKEWVRLITRSLQEWFRYQGNVLLNKVPNFGPDGGFYEGLNYANYSVLTFLRYAEALRSATGEDILSANPALAGLCDFFLYCAYESPDGWYSLNFGDSSSTFVPSSALLLDLARLTNNPQILWYWEKAYGAPRQVFDLLWFPLDLKSSPPDGMPLAKLFEGIDWAVLRSSWSAGSTLFALTCGDFWNHAHADAGSFILYSHGKPLIIDSGTCSYSRKEYTEYFCQSNAHNVILWNGQGQPTEDRYRGSRFRGEIRGWLSSPWYTYFYADATGPYASLFSRNYRHVIAIDGMFIIVDDLLAHNPGIFSWLVHPGGKLIFQDQALQITNPPTAADLRFVFPTDLTLEERSGLEEKTLKPKPYLAFRTAQPKRNAKFISVLSTRKAADPPPPHPKQLAGSDWIGVLLNSSQGTVEVLCNLLADGRRMHENSENEMDGYVTDAFLLVLVRDRMGSLIRFALHNGSFLRDASGPIFESINKSHIVVDEKIDRIEAAIRSQPGARIMLKCPRPTEVILNGSPAPEEHWQEELSLQEISLTSQTGHILIRW